MVAHANGGHVPLVSRHGVDHTTGANVPYVAHSKSLFRLPPEWLRIAAPSAAAHTNVLPSDGSDIRRDAMD
jgi:hypothetical protein